MIDESHSRYVLGYNAGHDISQSWRHLTYLAVADRPTTSAAFAENLQSENLQLRIASITPNPGHGYSQIRMLLPSDGLLRVRIYSVDGRLVAKIANDNLPAGEHTLTWNRTTIDGTKAPSGVYILHGLLEKNGRVISETSGRVSVLK